MPTCLAIHWTATTYGTWLHGDRRGSWLGGRLIPGDHRLRAESRSKMAHDAVALSVDEQRQVRDTVRNVCDAFGHDILALTVQPTHLHLVLAPPKEAVKLVIARLKRQTSMAVLRDRRERNVRDLPRSIWTAKRYVVFLDDQKHLDNTLAYVERHNQPV